MREESSLLLSLTTRPLLILLVYFAVLLLLLALTELLLCVELGRVLLHDLLRKADGVSTDESGTRGFEVSRL